MRWIKRWFAWFRPVKGWRKRYIAYVKGQTTWSVPGKPEVDKLFPFPLEWIPHSMSEDPRGFDFLVGICANTGKPLRIGVGVRCLRCGVDLHPKEAHMQGDYDPPRCSRCTPIISLVKAFSL